jgi:predicted RNA-binding protein YlxR (DUF448 family)/ribosomal protein L7Ae-like RNA K-turn-binding protein
MNETVSESNRACAGCRQTDAREVLLRFVAGGDPPQLAPDIRRRAPGRGVSVHARFRCVEAAFRSGAMRRTLGVGADVGMGASARELSQAAVGQYERRAAGLLIAAQRSRKVALGTEAVRTAIAAHTVQLLLVAVDAEGSREELVAAATRLGKGCLIWSNRENLGRLFGRAVLSVIGVLDAGIATELRHVVRCATELAEDA